MRATDLIRWMACPLLLLTAAIFVWRLCAGSISLRGLLVSKTGAQRVTPERVQLLVVTVVVAGWYGSRVVAAGGRVVPGLSAAWLWSFAASCSVYAIGKAMRTFWMKSH